MSSEARAASTVSVSTTRGGLARPATPPSFDNSNRTPEP